jgi:DNA-binding transcriptional ArsR family regulator
MSGSGGKQAAARQSHALAFGALGDPTRLSLVSRLAEGRPRSITQLADGSALTRQAITRHLRVLESAGIVRNIRLGRESLFEFKPSGIDDIRHYLESVSARWDEALARLKSFVEE